MYEPEWRQPAGKSEVLAVLAELGEKAALIAGGTDLAPLISRRATRPPVLVDLCRADDLRYVSEDPEGGSGAHTASERLGMAANAKHMAGRTRQSRVCRLATATHAVECGAYLFRERRSGRTLGLPIR